MIRDIIKIDEKKCDGCGLCVPTCHEGAIQIIDGKARLISQLMCDGLGNCLGNCPQDAITIEKREADDYDELFVIEKMLHKGANTIIAHLKHLKDHKQFGFLKQAVSFLKSNKNKTSLDIDAIINEVHNYGRGEKQDCKETYLGSASRSMNKDSFVGIAPQILTGRQSELQQWPIQLHLINPNATYFTKTDLLIAADCTAFAYGDFHSFIAGKKLVIACPKLDQNQERYINILISLIDNSKVNTITVAIMEVPCCSGLAKMAQLAIQQASRKIPLKLVIIGIRGTIQSEEWI